MTDKPNKPNDFAYRGFRIQKLIGPGWRVVNKDDTVVSGAYSRDFAMRWVDAQKRRAFLKTNGL